MDQARQSVELSKSFRLLNHGPVTMVTCTHQGQRNVMSASWVMPLDFNPAKVLLVVDGRSLSHELIEASGEFALNIPCLAMADKILAAGGSSGRSGDKIDEIGLEIFTASQIQAPLIQGCVAWLECRVISEPANQTRYDLFIAEVVAAWADPAVFSEGRWHFPDRASRTLHYQSGGSFFLTGDVVDLSNTGD